MEYIHTCAYSIYNTLFPRKSYCLISNHKHTVDILIENKPISLRPLEHYIIITEQLKKTVVMCETCQIKKEILLKPSKFMYYDSEIIDIFVD